MVAGTGNKKLLVRVSNISFSQIIKRLQQLALCCVELVELLPRGGGGGGGGGGGYSDIFTYT